MTLAKFEVQVIRMPGFPVGQVDAPASFLSLNHKVI